MLGVGKSTIHRVLAGRQEPPGIVRVRLCEVLSEEELMEVLKGRQLLARYGLVDDEGRLNKPLALALVDALMQDEASREEVLNYLFKYYKKELTERLLETLPRYELRWTPGFEVWLTEKKSKPPQPEDASRLQELLVPLPRGQGSRMAPHKAALRQQDAM